MCHNDGQSEFDWLTYKTIYTVAWSTCNTDYQFPCSDRSCHVTLKPFEPISPQFHLGDAPEPCQGPPTPTSKAAHALVVWLLCLWTLGPTLIHSGLINHKFNKIKAYIVE